MSPEPITAEHLHGLGFAEDTPSAGVRYYRLFFRDWSLPGRRCCVTLWPSGAASIASERFNGYANSPADLARQIEFMNAAEGTHLSGFLPVTCANKSRAERGSDCADPAD